MNIYITNKKGEIIDFLNDQTSYNAEEFYGAIGQTVCEEYFDSDVCDFADKMKELAFHISEIDLRAHNRKIIAIKLYLDHEPINEDDDGKNESCENNALFN
jgi:hypothetical protein